MNIRKAIIPAAGSGTRMLPVTKTIQKEMLPIVDKPIIDYIVDDCIKAGIEEIIFVVSEQNTQIRHYYSEEQYWRRYLSKMNKLDKYEKIAILPTKAKFTFVIQKETDPYGTSVPLMLVKELVKNEEAFMLLMGDDFFFHNTESGSEAKAMIEEFNKSNVDGLITCVNVPLDIQHKYGIADYTCEGDVKLLSQLIEKPHKGATTSTLANTSKYILTPKIFDYIEKQEADPVHGEFFITTPLSHMLEDGLKILVHEGVGDYLDCGYAFGWLKANLAVAKSNPELWELVKNYLDN